MLAYCTFAIMPSCVDEDEEIFSQVTADNFFQTEEELISALGAAYTSLYGYMGASNFWGANEVSSDELTVPTRGSGWGDGGHWVRGHTHSWSVNDPMVNSVGPGQGCVLISGTRPVDVFQDPVGIGPITHTCFSTCWSRFYPARF